MAKQKKKRRSGSLLPIVSLLVLVTAFSAGTYAKYQQKKAQTVTASASRFYVSSDFLTADAEPPVYHVADGELFIALRNFENGNRAQENVEYAVSVTGGSCTPANGVLNADADHTATLQITPTAGADTVTVTVTTLPYAQTLRAVFCIGHNSTTSYSVTDKGYYIALELYTGSTAEPVTVNYGAGLVPDNTDKCMESWISKTAGTLTGLSPHAHYTLIFFESTAGNYSTQMTAIEGGGITLTGGS